MGQSSGLVELIGVWTEESIRTYFEPIGWFWRVATWLWLKLRLSLAAVLTAVGSGLVAAAHRLRTFAAARGDLANAERRRFLSESLLLSTLKAFTGVLEERFSVEERVDPQTVLLMRLERFSSGIPTEPISEAITPEDLKEPLRWSVISKNLWLSPESKERDLWIPYGEALRLADHTGVEVRAAYHPTGLWVFLFGKEADVHLISKYFWEATDRTRAERQETRPRRLTPI